jgi:hypothetical protein
MGADAGCRKARMSPHSAPPEYARHTRAEVANILAHNLDRANSSQKRHVEAYRGAMAKIWIVQHDESAHNTVLGIFSTQAEATAFADEVKDQFINGVIYASFDIGYRFDRGTGLFTSEPRS